MRDRAVKVLSNQGKFEIRGSLELGGAQIIDSGTLLGARRFELLTGDRRFVIRVIEDPVDGCVGVVDETAREAPNRALDQWLLPLDGRCLDDVVAALDLVLHEEQEWLNSEGRW